MWVCNGTDTFQENISKLLEGFNMVRAYIYDLLVITINDFKDHINKLEKLTQRLAESVLKVNA